MGFAILLLLVVVVAAADSESVEDVLFMITVDFKVNRIRFV